MERDYHKRIQETILNTAIVELPSEFIMGVVLHMDDGSSRIMSPKDFEKFSNELNDEDFIDELGIEEVSCQIDMDYAVEFVHHHTKEMLDNLKIVKF